jgi:8-oxo-dGTP diphosphatase
MNEFIPPKHIVAVSVLITNSKGEILMVRSPKRGWEMPGGQVEEGESLIEALQREILEESGAVTEIGALVGVYSNIKPPPKVIFAFLGTWLSGELITSSESLEVEWVARDEVVPRITHPAIYDRLSDMLNFTGKVTYRVYTTDPYHLLSVQFV